MNKFFQSLIGKIMLGEGGCPDSGYPRSGNLLNYIPAACCKYGSIFKKGYIFLL